jgi:hypothetical protein
MLHRLVIASPLLFALAITSSTGSWPRDKPKVTVDRQVHHAAGYVITTTTTTLVYRPIWTADTQALGRESMPPSRTVTMSQLGPGGRAQEAFNTVLRQSIGDMSREAVNSVYSSGRIDLARPASIEFAATVTAAAPGMIAADLSWSIFPHDMMKASENSRPLIWSFRQGRALTVEDLFDPATHWWTALVPRMMDSAYEEQLEIRIAGYEQIDRSQAPGLSPEGVWLKFHADDSGSFVLAQPLLLSWKVVRPYLRQQLPFDPAGIESVAVEQGPAVRRN